MLCGERKCTPDNNVIIEYIMDAQGRKVKKLKPLLIKSEPDREYIHHIHSDDNLHYCYVRQCSLVLNFFICLGFQMCFTSLYGALSLHNCSSSGSLVFARLGRIN